MKSLKWQGFKLVNSEKYQHMQITIIAIGKGKGAPEMQAYAHYLKALPWNVTLKELSPEAASMDSASRKQKEGRALLEALPRDANVVALDERGRLLDSPAFSQKLEHYQNSGKTLCFLIGGADGLSEEVWEQAEMLLSFGKMVWPHMLVRAMLAEQLFRGWSILNNHPYHRA